jgi:RNA polymerase sigma-70 factor (ECF subfamily)
MTISKLPEDEQELIFLRYVNEVSITAICKITGLSRFAVYRKLSKSLKWLKEELLKEGFSNG